MSNTNLKITEVAGLSNQDWQARKEDAVARGQGNIAPVYVERAAGSELWDVEGKRFIDFGTGIAVCSAGHCHPKINAAVAAQRDIDGWLGLNAARSDEQSRYASVCQFIKAHGNLCFRNFVSLFTDCACQSLKIR